ncbi:MAG TPA: DUF417 family protein [Myxococcaceae bacterium]|nr:DUF417 family protein [Myxococcaceae bacterium]
MSATTADVTSPTQARIAPGNQALAAAFRFETAARWVARGGLIAILLVFGLFKFTAEEAAAIKGMAEHSPFLGWLYGITSTQGASNVIGVTELLIATLLAAHRWLPRAAAAGGIWAAGMFVITLSFLVTTPGVLKDPSAFGFLIKDVFLFGAALTAAAESLRAVARAGARP